MRLKFQVVQTGQPERQKDTQTERQTHRQIASNQDATILIHAFTRKLIQKVMSFIVFS